MLKSLALAGFVFASVNAQAEEAQGNWRMARATKVDVLESLPPQYEVTYFARCNDLDAKVVQFQDGNETIVGVAVKRGGIEECTEGEKPFEKKKIRAVGNATDSGTVKVLR